MIIKSIKIIILALSLLVIFNIGSNTTLAAETTSVWGDEDIEQSTKDAIGLTDKDPITLIASIIRVVLGFLGMIALLTILYSGFLFMTSKGNPNQIDQAKQVLVSAVIGLVIILASFGIAKFLIEALTGASRGSSSSPAQNGQGSLPSFIEGVDYDRLPTEGQPCLTDALGGCWTGRCAEGLKCDSRDCKCKANLSGEGDVCL